MPGTSMSDPDDGANTVQNTRTRGLMPPWPKGVSGNASGRPKRKPITEAYERILQDPKVADAIARAMVRQAKKGNVRATVEVTDRVEGKLMPDKSESTQIGIKTVILPAEMCRPSEQTRKAGTVSAAMPENKVMGTSYGKQTMQESPNRRAVRLTRYETFARS